VEKFQPTGQKGKFTSIYYFRPISEKRYKSKSKKNLLWCR